MDDTNETTENIERLVSEEKPNVDLLLEEFKQAGTMPNGFYDVTYDEEYRRQLWAGQSPDGRKWDENLPDGKEAKPWNGCSDTRVPLVDEVVNDLVDMLSEAFWKAELRATSVNVDMEELAQGVCAYLHWLAHTKLKTMLELEVELAAQFMGEYGWCAAYVGWEREVARRRIEVTLDQLAALGQQVQTAGQGQTGAAPGQTASSPLATLAQDINDPSLEEQTIPVLQELFKNFVQEQLKGQGFYESELADDALVKLKPSTARKAIRELRETGRTRVPFPYLVRNGPLVLMMKPYLEVLAARGTAMLQQARAIFVRRWMTEAQVDAMKADGWDAAWCDEVKKTKGNISSWAGALGQTSITGPATKTIANTTYLKITEENNPLIEVVYGLVRKVDEDGVTGIFETIFSPHITRINDVEAYAKHGPVDGAHGKYPAVEFKRENMGRSIIETRSVAEVAGTWQQEEKNQRDMIFNRAQWDTLPPIAVPKLGGVDYKLGPAAQVPLSRGQTVTGINLGNGTSIQTAVEVVGMVQARTDNYFCRDSQSVPPAKTAARQSRQARSFFSSWAQILKMCFANTLQYNPEEITRVTGNPAIAQIDPATVMDGLDVALEFDIKELNPDYLQSKMDNASKIIPTDSGGVINRSALTALQMKWLDPGLARQVIQNPQDASQQMWREVQQQVISMAQGNEAEYTENDPAAGNKLSYLQGIVKNNPKYLAKLGKVQDPQTPADPRFQEVLQNYVKNLQQSVAQDQNKTIGRIGVKPLGATGQPQG